MQHTLLGFGLALIAAIIAAFAAPFFVDWNAWRPAFEQRASLVVGAPVTIKGPIEAKLLPTPAFVLRDVTVGDPAPGTGLSAQQVRGALSLGALLRLSVEAEEIALTKPSMRLALDPGGKIMLPRGAVSGAANLSISRFTIDSGSLTIDNRAAGKSHAFGDVSLSGELTSRSGPLKLEGSLTQDGKPWNLRAATGQFGADSNGRLRLSLTRLEDAFGFDADGGISLSEATPRFEGKINLGQQTDRLPWKLSTNAKADLQSLALDTIELSLGKDMPVTLTGSARIQPLAKGVIDASLSAKILDFDHLDGTGENPNLAATLAPLRNALARLEGAPLNGNADISIDQILAGGGTVRDLRGKLALRDGRLVPEKLDARLPGRGTFGLAGMVAKDGSFNGQLKISADDASALLGWSGVPLDIDGPLKLDSRVFSTPKQFSMEQLSLALAGSKLGGNFSYDETASGRPARASAKLSADTIDLSLLMPIMKDMLALPASFDTAIALDARAANLFGQTARRFEVAFSRDAKGLSIDRLSLEDLGGLNVSARGRIDSGIRFQADAAKADGLLVLLQSFAGEGDTVSYARRIAAAGLPLRLSGTLTRDDASKVLVKAGGSLGDTQVTLAARGASQPVALDDLQLALGASDASKLVAVLGLPAPEPLAGQGRFDLAIGREENGAAPLRAHLAFPGIELNGSGELRHTENRIEPRVDLKLDATDLRALSIAAARTSGAVVPANGSARLVRRDGGFALEDIALDLGGSRVAGQAGLKGFEQPELTGALSMSRANLPTLLALTYGIAGDGAPWSDRALSPPPLSGVSGAFDIESASLGLIGPFDASGAKLKLRFDKNQTTVENLSGDLAGGKLAARLRLSGGDMLTLDGSLSLQDVDAEKLLAVASGSIVRGKGSFTLDLSGQGASPAQLAANLAGRGKFAIEPFEIDRLAPDAIARAIAATSKSDPADEGSIRPLFLKAMEQAPLRIARLEGPIVVAGGVARTGKIVTKLEKASAVSEASLDLAKLNFDAAVGLEGAPPSGMNARPGAVVRWRGPLGPVERSVDITPLVTVIALRAMDSEMRRLDGRDRATSLLPSDATPTAETALTPPPSPAAPVPRKRPNNPAPAVAPLPPPVNIGPAPGTPRFN